MPLTKPMIRFITSIAIFLLSVHVNAAELYQLQTPGNVSLDYEPFSGLPSSNTFYLTLKKNNRNSKRSAQRRSYNVRIKPSGLTQFNARRGAQSLPISLRSLGASDLRKIGDEYVQPLLGSTLNDNNIELQYEVSVPESIFAKPGVYTLPLEIELSDSSTRELIGNSLTTNLRIQVRPKIQTNIAGTRASYEDGSTFSVVDFGKLESGESERVFIQVRGNAMAKLKISSDNRGQLVHRTIPSLKVNYAIKIDGQQSELRQPLLLSKPVAQNLQGSAYPMDIIVGDVTKSFAGNYQDVITISVSPQ